MLVLVAVILSGCSSKQEQALDQAKKQAAATGQAQQVVSVDKNGTTTTTVVQPPAAGQANEADNDDGDTARSWSTCSSTLGTGGFRGAATGEHFGGHHADHPDRSAHQRKNQPRGDTFTGEMVDPVLASDNSVLVPKGALVAGVVDVSHRRGHFKGRSLLELRLDLTDAEWNAVSAGQRGTWRAARRARADVRRP